MERKTTEEQIRELQQQNRQMLDLLLDLAAERGQPAELPSTEPEVVEQTLERSKRLKPMELFDPEDMRAIAYGIAEIGQRQIDEIITAAGYNRMEKIVWSIAYAQRYEYVITRKQMEVLSDRLNKEKYWPVAKKIRAAANAHRMMVAAQIAAAKQTKGIEATSVSQ